MKSIYAALAVLVLGFAGCSANSQVPPVTHSATVTITNAPCLAGTPASSCGYVFSSAVSVGGNCKATNGTNYTPLNQSNPVPQPASGNASYVDASAAGQTLCYIAQACQANGTQCFQPSTAAGPATVLPNLTAPSLGQPTVAQNDKPEAPIEELASNTKPVPALAVLVR